LLAGYAVSWDLRHLDKNFNRLYSWLKTTRWDAFYKETTIVVKFNGSVITVINQNDSKNMTTSIPMIAKVDYDTVMGNDMIVYDWHGTGEYNKRIHSGEIMLKSLLGFWRRGHRPADLHRGVGQEKGQPGVRSPEGSTADKGNDVLIASGHRVNPSP
jgi:hypothetical protein